MLLKIARAIRWRFNHYFNVNSMQLHAWYRDDVKGEYRYAYDLNGNSLVFDIGGYQGEWAEKIYDLYKSNILIFEPHPVFYMKLVDKFSEIEKVTVYNFGLGAKTESSFLSDEENESSTMKNAGGRITVSIKSITDFLIENNIGTVDLVKINIEGGEYELLESLIKSEKVSTFLNIQVQFHNFFSDAYKRMEKIKKDLLKTHHPTYKYRFVWENWKKNDFNQT